jgi:hypothetical protein
MCDGENGAGGGTVLAFMGILFLPSRSVKTAREEDLGTRLPLHDRMPYSAVRQVCCLHSPCFASPFSFCMPERPAMHDKARVPHSCREAT